VGAQHWTRPLSRLSGLHLLVLAVNPVPSICQFAGCLLVGDLVTLPVFRARDLQLVRLRLGFRACLVQIMLGRGEVLSPRALRLLTEVVQLLLRFLLVVPRLLSIRVLVGGRIAADRSDGRIRGDRLTGGSGQYTDQHEGSDWDRGNETPQDNSCHAVGSHVRTSGAASRLSGRARSLPIRATVPPLGPAKPTCVRMRRRQGGERPATQPGVGCVATID